MIEAGPISPEFQDAAKETERPRRRRKSPPPFSLRLTETEKARLKRDAGGQPIGAYIRSILFGVATNPHLRHGPTAFHERLALILASLGQSGLAANMNELAQAARSGSLEVTPDIAYDLKEACTDIAHMRQILIEALGIKPEG